MERMNPWLTGAALAITITVSSALCAFLLVAFPEGWIAFLNSMFGGLDFGKPQPASGGYSLVEFGAATVAMALVGSFIGALYGGLRKPFRDDSASERP